MSKEELYSYVDRGWNIIPIYQVRENGLCACGNMHINDPGSIGKHPCLKTWKEFQTRRVTKEMVDEWWERYPGANVALITGDISGVAALDDDSKEIQGRYETLCSKTGSGGHHYLFSLNGHSFGCKPIRDPAFGKGSTLKGNGGYIILPPSNHVEGTYEWENDLPLAPIPAEIIKLYNTDKESETGERKGPYKEGERNVAMTKEVGRLLGKGLQPQEVLAYMKEWIVVWTEPVLELQEVRNAIVSLWRNRERPKRAENLKEPEVKGPRGGLIIRSGRYMFEKYGGKEQRWLIPHWLPAGTVCVMDAPPETYKTWFLLELALSLTTGRPFLGRYPVNVTGKVLVVQQEDNFTDLLDRTAKLLHVGEAPALNGYYGTQLIPNALPDFTEDRVLHVQNIQSMEDLEDYVNGYRPIAVLIDPFFSFVPLSEDYGVEAAQLINSKVKTLRDRYNVTFLFSHHTSKGSAITEAKGGRQRDSQWGSQFLNAMEETGWHLRNEKEGGNIITVSRHTKNMGHEEKSKFRIGITDWNCVIRAL